MCVCMYVCMYIYIHVYRTITENEIKMSGETATSEISDMYVLDNPDRYNNPIS